MGGPVMEIDAERKIDSPYYTPDEAAKYLRLEESTLNAMRWRKEGPPFRKHGGKVVYHREALEDWSRERDSAPQKRKIGRPNGDV